MKYFKVLSHEMIFGRGSGSYLSHQGEVESLQDYIMIDNLCKISVSLPAELIFLDWST